MEISYNALKLNPDDNVAVALQRIGKSEAVLINNSEIELVALEEIPYGHKIALRTIIENDDITKYGECMGKATKEIPAGSHVHVHNVRGLNEMERAVVINHVMEP
ncbi:UxaA family hydrolase [Sporosarcina cascadiensis]|uniref:UxaA family hydrolase n=1 Tax=Sporosarcina cascadiensis TaxID=2660747 RepID=UPI00129BDB76|nr:UxaA family hydrolase [Sporosarcina cascadiensis]